MVYESLAGPEQGAVRQSLASLMGLNPDDERNILDGTLIRKIEPELFDAERADLALNVECHGHLNSPVEFELTARQLPAQIPANWEVSPFDEEGKRFRVTVNGGLAARLGIKDEMQVKAAGQLPNGFDPGKYYRSTHHPRGLQLSVLAASDAINSLGIDWQKVRDAVDPDAISVYSSSVMCQLDHTGVGGMMNSRILGKRATSKQLSLGFTSMPADFTNAYVLGSLGATGAVTGACATFLYNLRWAVEDIRSGRRKVAVVGCSEAPILPEVIDGFAAMSALATDDDLRKLDGGRDINYRRASRPFGENCGFTIAESSQYVVIMADDLALALGAEVYGAVPGVYVNADGFKKSISAPGAGNYLTMAKAVGLAKTLVGEELIRDASFVQAHGSSTPHNRVTESKIFDEIAAAFDISAWPVSAVKSYLGHSLGPASGDQLASTLGVFAHGILPGIKTIDGVAQDVYADRLCISNKDIALGESAAQIAFLNSKGFGGNNATATVFAPKTALRFLENRYSEAELDAYRAKRETTLANRDHYLAGADLGDLNTKYEFGTNLIDETKIDISSEQISFPGYAKPVTLVDDEGLGGF